MVKVKKQIVRSDTTPKAIKPKAVKPKATKRKEKSKKYLEYQRHLKSKEFKEVKRIVIERDKCCQFCGRTEEELVLKNGKKLTWNVHHLPEGYNHLFDEPEEEAKYCRLYCSACHHYGHLAPSNRGRFTKTFTDNIEEKPDNNEISNDN